MSTKPKYFSILFTTLVALGFQPVRAQDKLIWLDEYTNEMIIGTETYRYNFNNVDGSDCKLKIEEQITDKKGSTEVHAWIFYLSDIDPDAISFKAKGKSIAITMETNQSQKFITYYEKGEIGGYTEKINIAMNEVDMTRSFIETIKVNIANCKATQATWENRDQAFTWLVNNVAKANDEEIKWDQKIEPGSRNYLVDFQATSVNEKGEEKLSGYKFDLNDINPLEITLKISGKSLMVEVPVREGKRFIKVNSAAGTEFTNKLLIYADDIELARQIVHALSYVVSNTTPERQQWDSYSASLRFVKDNLGEVKISDELFSHGFNFDASPSGLVNLVIGKSDSDGTTETKTYSFYLTDIMDKVRLEVSKYDITIGIDTENKRDFIREMKDEKVTDYTSTLGFHVSDIDMARDILYAFEYAIGKSEEKIKEFSSVSEAGTWFTENIVLIETDGDKNDQNITIKEEVENQLIIENKLTESDGGNTETRYILYPEDISLDKLNIKVSGKKLSVLLQTEKDKYIKKFENGKLQNFTGSAEILFFDILTAKNFMEAIRFLKLNSVVENRTSMNKDEAFAFLSGNIQNMELPDKKYEQKLEMKDDGTCRMSFTRSETDNKGTTVEYSYEFIVTDIHPGNSAFSLKGTFIGINLVTRGNEKLIKPYKNGEVGDFVDDFVIYVDDILLAKKTLGAFASLSKSCN